MDKGSKYRFWISIILIALFVLGISIIMNNDFSVSRIIVSSISGGFIGATIMSIITKRIRVNTK